MSPLSAMDQQSSPATTPSGKPIGPRLRKIALLGARSVGKSSLVVQFVDSHFVESYYPTIENTFEKAVKVNGSDFSLEIHDTAGQDDYSIIGTKQAVGLHGWVLVYSITSRKSFEMISIIRDKILSYTGVDSVPIIIVGNKTDLHMHRKVQPEEAEQLAKEWGCGWIESSARDNSNVKKIFDLMVLEVEKSQNPAQDAEKKARCVVS